MLVVLLSVIYISVVAFGLGLLGLAFLDRTIKYKKYEEMTILMIGIVIATVYAEIFSLFGRVYAFAHVIALLLSILGYLLNKKYIKKTISNIKSTFISKEGLVYVLFALFIAFFASRGDFHTDTNIYHAATIRIFEDYGIIKGLGNLQLHYAYNSSSLAFASLFSLKFVFGYSVHATTAFFEMICGVYAIYGLTRFRQHKLHFADSIRVAILFYILIILVRSMSPATDFSTNLMALLLIARFFDNMEGTRSTEKYALLSIFAVYVVTMKFSACLIVLIVIYPAVILIKNKKFKDIIVYLLLGVIVLAPFLIRNYILSGWLLYPFSAIDIFNPVWKIPKEYLEHDAAQIKVWGRCLYDVTLLDLPFKEWFKVWLSKSERYEIMLIYGTMFGALASFVIAIKNIITKKEYAYDYICAYIAIIACLLVWLFEAPFIRYGLAFILPMIFIPIGVLFNDSLKGMSKALITISAFVLLTCLTWYYDNYVLDMAVFLKQRAADPYYIQQKQYDNAKTEYIEINGNKLYYCAEGEINSYYYCPNTCYEGMLRRSTLIGDRIEDGFKPN